MDRKITLPASKEELKSLRAGDIIRLSGVIYTARDAAHKRICDMLSRGEKPPFPIERSVIYYSGPCPTKPGDVIGSCGPTTSYRMDKYAPVFYENGADGAIGKGVIGTDVKEAMKKHGCVYFIATGGAGALLKSRVKKCDIVAFPELGAEAVRRLEVEDMPLIVGVDTKGRDIYESALAETR